MYVFCYYLDRPAHISSRTVMSPFEASLPENRVILDGLSDRFIAVGNFRPNSHRFRTDFQRTKSRRKSISDGHFNRRKSVGVWIGQKSEGKK